MPTTTPVALLSIAVTALGLVAAPQGRHELKERGRTESAEAVEVPGGALFRASAPIDRAFETVLNGFRRKDVVIDSADKDICRIVTAMTVTGAYTQSGARLIVTFIKESDSETSVRVTATIQKRKKLLQAEPWGAPKLDAAATTKAAADLKTLFGL